MDVHFYKGKNMAYYSYKRVRDLIPQYIIDTIQNYDSDPGYDGDLHLASALYINELKGLLEKVLEKRYLSEDVELQLAIKKATILDINAKKEFELKLLSKY